MAIIRDMIPAFELFQPTSAEDAIDRLIEYGDEGWVLAGGMDSFDWWKE
ncbi:MAG TPA: xanthine dehydrogenase family protein subunit M, partial [Gemmatimonadetes bacterium]|nr:xanthine dehydrogenase family protein subunit M [Gemmatimonadota bacterium]